MNPPQPSAGRVTAALLAASVVAPFAFGLMVLASAPEDGWWLILPIVLFGFPVALIHALVLGLPAYLLVRLRWRLAWGNSAVAGLLIGALPSGFLVAQNLGAAMMTGGAGLVGGLIFWLVLRRARAPGADDLRRTFA